MRHLSHAGLAAALLAATGAAAEMPAFYDLGGRPDKELVAAGLNYFRAARFAGSAETRTIVVPSATWVATNGLFADVVNGVGWNASADKRFEYGVRATAGLGREATGALHDMGRIPNRVAVGGFANWNPLERVELQSSLRYGSGYARDGMLVDVGASWDFFRVGYFSASLDVSASWANAAYMRSFYGVTPEQSAATGYRAYAPGAGPHWSTLGLSITTPLHERVLATLSVERTRLGSRAAGSPYTARRDATTIQANVSFVFRGLD